MTILEKAKEYQKIKYPNFNGLIGSLQIRNAYIAGAKETSVEIAEQEAEERHEKQFRVGDIVYVNDNNHDYNTPYFLRESYNGEECWYVTRTEDGIYDKSLHFAVMTRDISHEAPKVCRYCNQLIK